MKKLIIATVALAALTFVSCKKDNLQPTTNSTNIGQVNNETSNDDDKLSPAQRAQKRVAYALNYYKNASVIPASINADKSQERMFFVSKCLKAGGWINKTSGSDNNKKWFISSGNTFSMSSYNQLTFRKFLQNNPNRATKTYNWKNLKKGDVILVEQTYWLPWDNITETRYYSYVVTGKTATDILVTSYKTGSNNTINESWLSELNNYNSMNEAATFHYYKIK